MEQPGVATYLGELPVGHKSGQGLAHAPLLLRAQVLGDHLDAHLEGKNRWRSEDGRNRAHQPEALVRQEGPPQAWPLLFLYHLISLGS